MDARRDPRLLRLFDLEPDDVVEVRCLCGRIVEYGDGLLQRRYGLPSDTLIYDLQFHLRCQHCTRRKGFKIVVYDRRSVGDSSKERIERVIVEPKE